MVDRTTAARAIQKLEKNAFLRKVNDARNKKIKRLLPTEKALTTYEKIIAEHTHSTNMALNGLSVKEIEQLQQMIQIIKSNIVHDW